MYSQTPSALRRRSTPFTRGPQTTWRGEFEGSLLCMQMYKTLFQGSWTSRMLPGTGPSAQTIIHSSTVSEIPSGRMSPRQTFSMERTKVTLDPARTQTTPP